MNLKPEELVKALLYCGNGGDCDACCHPCHGEHGEFEWRCLGPLLLHAASQIERDQKELAALRELAVADQEGRVIVLPCKVGDTVFALLDNKSKYVSECEVKKIGLGDNIGFATIVPVGYSQEYGVSLRGFGKTFFLMREEAEKALAERERMKE